MVNEVRDQPLQSQNTSLGKLLTGIKIVAILDAANVF